ncbi:MAG: hypothetical protein JSU94_01680 [Phycisphaerales bacterium]|nr:MAG: hypothetical protein JSU94_01680 [Phycisphaerales bacterium]
MRRTEKKQSLNWILAGVLWGAALPMYAGSVCVGQMTDPAFTVKSLLEAMLRAESERPPVAMDLNIQRHTPRDPCGVVHRYSSKYITDGTRFDVTVEQHEYDLGASKETLVMNKRAVWDGQMYASRENSTILGVSTYVAGTGKYGKVPPIRQNKWAAPWADAIPIGDYVSVAQLLASSANAVLAPKMENIDGFATYVLESRNKRGLYRVWVDPENGFVPRKITVRREKNDLHRDGPLRGGTVEIEISGVQIEKVGGHYVVTKSTVNERVLFRERLIESQTLDVKRENIEWNPDFEKMGAFVIDGIPEGAKVLNFDFPDLPHIWADGRAIIDSGLTSTEDANTIASEPDANNSGEPERSDLQDTGNSVDSSEQAGPDLEKDEPVSDVVAVGDTDQKGSSRAIIYVLGAVAGVAIIFLVARRHFRA